MTLLMRDAIDARSIPSDTPVVAGYGDGEFIWSPSWADGSNWWDLFPGAVQLVIVVSAAHAGDVLDVETGDASPGEVPGWVGRFSRPGRRRPTIYAARSTWPDVVAALRGAGLDASAVDWWAATLDGTHDVPGAVAVQYVDLGTYDESVIVDPSWIGGPMTLDPSDPVIVDLRNRLGGIQYVLGPAPGQDGAQGELLARVRSIDTGGAAVKVELDTLKAEIEAGGSVDAAAAIARIEKALQGA